MARKKNAPVLKNNLRNAPAEKFRAVNRMNGIVTMVEYSSEDDIKAYELEPTFRELGGGGGFNVPVCRVKLINTSPDTSHFLRCNFAVDIPRVTLTDDGLIDLFDSVILQTDEENEVYALITPFQFEEGVTNYVVLSGVESYDLTDISYSDLQNIEIITITQPDQTVSHFPQVIDITKPSSFTISSDNFDKEI